MEIVNNLSDVQDTPVYLQTILLSLTLKPELADTRSQKTYIGLGTARCLVQTYIILVRTEESFRQSAASNLPSRLLRSRTDTHRCQE